PECEGARDSIGPLLHRALVALARDRQTGIAGWWPGAWARLPDLGRSTPTAAQLCLVTSPLLEGDAVPLPSDAPVELDARLDAALREVPDVAVGVLRTGRVLALGDVSR